MLTTSLPRFQTTVTLPSKSRGSYLITPHIERSLPQIREYKTGLLNLFVQHTSCALSLNENWDEDVRADMSDALDRIVPEDKKGEGIYRHDAEGSDDMPVCVCSLLEHGRRIVFDIGRERLTMRIRHMLSLL